MSVNFNAIPGNIRVPFMRFEVNAGESPYQSIARLLLIGQVTPAGATAQSVPVLVVGQEDGLFGFGSMLASMYKTARANAPFQEIWAMPLPDVAGATKATSTLVVSTTLTPVGAADTMVVYIGGCRIAIPVSTTLSASTIATILANAINACPGILVTAAAVANTVTLTANNAGTVGNSVRIETRLSQDDGPMADVLLTITQPTGGTGDPDMVMVTTALADDQWDWIVMPYAQNALLDEMKQWLDARWGPISQMYGHVISAMDATIGVAQAFLSNRNNMHESIMPMYQGPQPPCLLASAIGAVAATHLQDAPELSKPLQTLELVGIRAPKLRSSQFGVAARQSLYYAGGCGYTVDRDGTVRIDRIVTTYQRNVYGQPDQAWLDVNTIAQIMYGVRYFWHYMTDTYPRCALVDSNPNNLQDFVTATDIRNAYIHAYRSLVALGVFENADVFASLLIVERNVSDPNRVDAYLPLDSVNQLRILAANATSYLQYPAAA